uniref:Uncharacterized protein n=1 Tax=Arundo donax TaxID=35708 RepID=A0A0A9B4Y7_ARUDO
MFVCPKLQMNYELLEMGYFGCLVTRKLPGALNFILVGWSGGEQP